MASHWFLRHTLHKQAFSPVTSFAIILCCKDSIKLWSVLVNSNNFSKIVNWKSLEFQNPAQLLANSMFAGNLWSFKMLLCLWPSSMEPWGRLLSIIPRVHTMYPEKKQYCCPSHKWPSRCANQGQPYMSWVQRKPSHLKGYLAQVGGIIGSLRWMVAIRSNQTLTYRKWNCSQNVQREWILSALALLSRNLRKSLWQCLASSWPPPP